MNTFSRILAAVSLLTATACLGASDGEGPKLTPSDSNPDNPSTPGDGSGQPGTNPSGDPAGTVGGQPSLMMCATGKSYKGFDKNALEASRVQAAIGADRARIKPYSSMAGEYQRVLGVTPALVMTAATSFPSAPARWFVEPFSSAVVLHTGLQIAFQGCLNYVSTNAQYATAPSQASATGECTAMAGRFWNRTPDQEQLDACATLAVNGTNGETDPTRRWAYACAALLNSAEFLSF